MIALVAVTAATALAAYPKLVAGFAARGVDLSWIHHVGLIVLSVLLGFAALAVVALVCMAAVIAGAQGVRLLRNLKVLK